MKLREMTISSSTMSRSDILVGGGKLGKAHGLTGLRLWLGKHIPNSYRFSEEWSGPELATHF